MGGASEALVVDRDPARTLDVVDEFVLSRIAVDGGATRGDLIRDLAPLLSHRLSPSQLRGQIDAGLEGLVGNGLVDAYRGRFRLSAGGAAFVGELLGARKLPEGWPALRDVRLVARALDVPGDAVRLRALERPDGLRAVILQKLYQVGGRRTLGVPKLRMSLAVIALERAFGNKIKGGLDAGRGLSVKASRLLAGQLARKPRDFGTDKRLISALAAEAVGASQTDPASLRLAILRQYVSERLGGPVPGSPVSNGDGAASADGRTGAADGAALAVVDDRGAAVPDRGQGPAAVPLAANRPDLDGFAREVLEIAGGIAEGWPGNRKAFISRVWQGVDAKHPEWGLSGIEFKSMLAEAHRTGHVVLASADIKNKDTLRDVQESAIAYKNTVWHFVRVEN